MKYLKSITVAIVLLVSSSIIAQTSHTTTTMKFKYPQWTLAPIGGVIIPIGVLADNIKAGPMFGLDVGYRANKEVGIFAQLGYYFLNSKTTTAPIGHYFEYTAGPRYFFTKPNLKSSLFLELGVGGYTFMQAAYVNPVDNSSIDQISETRAGVNTGIGATLALSKSVDFLIKSKYTLIFTPNGSSAFINVLAGVAFKLN